MIDLKKELSACGYEDDAETYRELVGDVFFTLYGRNWSTEDLVHRPDDAKHFCNVIRKETDCRQMPDQLICSTLTNRRKSGKLPGKPRKRSAKKTKP